MRNIYNILVIKLKRKRPLGTATYRWEHINIKCSAECTASKVTITNISATSSLMNTYTKSSMPLFKHLLHMNFLRL